MCALVCTPGVAADHQTVFLSMLTTGDTSHYAAQGISQTQVASADAIDSLSSACNRYGSVAVNKGTKKKRNTDSVK